MIQTTTAMNLDTLAARLEGRLVLPDSAEYEERRKIWNGMIDRRPAAFAVVKSTADVVAVVNYVRDEGLPVSVCGGGHNVAGNSLIDDGIVIDLREFRSVEVDAQRRVVRAQGGATLLDINMAVTPHDLGVPIGVVSDTGVAGLTLGGGLGWMMRKYGTTSDNLIGAEVVTAQGEVLQINEDQHGDLFWALRGGGNSPVAVTRFDYRAYDYGPELDLVFVIHPIEQAHEALRAFREFAKTAPDEISMIAVLGPVPPAPEIDEQYHHEDCLIFVGVWTGEPGGGDRALAPLKAAPTAIADLSGRVPRAEVEGFFDPDYPKGHRYYWKSRYIDGLPDDAIDFFIEQAKGRPSVESTVDIWLLGGALGRMDRTATAYAHRDAAFGIGIEANWREPAEDEANIAWGRGVFAGTAAYSRDGGLYINFPGFGEEQDDLLRKALGQNYDRLKEVVAKYDPEGIFTANAHIRVTE
ncbi:MAG: FAD-binding oxidoreductase [Dehalococcoidia bacterium]